MESTINIQDILSIRNIIIYFIAINIIAFFTMWIDKRKAQKGSWRIKEATLFMLGIFGGSIGAILGMYTFRHKTKKIQFVIGFPVILISEIIIFIYLKLYIL